MNRSSLVSLLLIFSVLFGFTQIASAKVNPNTFQDSASADYQGISQTVPQGGIGTPEESEGQLAALTREMEKDKELLGIWKDHVRALTKERDDAYKEIESLKKQGAVSSNSEVTPNEAVLKEKEDAIHQADYLKDQMTLLQKKYEQLQASISQNESSHVNSSQLALLQEKAEKLKVVEKELHDTRDYFSSYMKELDAKNKKALDENDTLRLQIQDAQAEKQKQVELEQQLTQLRSENSQFQQTQIQQSKTIHTLKTTIQSSLDSLDANCGGQQK